MPRPPPAARNAAVNPPTREVDADDTAAICCTDMPSVDAACDMPAIPVRCAAISTRNADAEARHCANCGPRSGRSFPAVRIATSAATVCKIGVGTIPAASASPVRPCTAPRKNEFKELPESRTIESMDPPSFSMSPARLSVRSAACLFANPAWFTCSVYLRMPSAPCSMRTFAPWIASAPKIVVSRVAFCSSDSFFVSR